MKHHCTVVLAIVATFLLALIGPTTPARGAPSDNAIAGFVLPGPTPAEPVLLIAQASGTRLHIFQVNRTTGAVSAWGPWAGGKELGGLVSARPGFAYFDGRWVVGVGTNNGKLWVFNLETGTVYSDLSFVGSVTSAPTYSGSGSIYWLVNAPAGPAIVRQSYTALADSLVIPGLGFVAPNSPLVFGNRMVVASQSGIHLFAVDSIGMLTPLTIGSPGSLMNTSPILTLPSYWAVFADITGQVYKENVFTGQIVPCGAAFSGAPLTSPVYRTTFSLVPTEVLFGGCNGSIYNHTADTCQVSSSASPLAPNCLTSILRFNNKLYAVDSTGRLAIGGTIKTLGSPPGKALVIVGTSGIGGQESKFYVAINTVDGNLWVFPA